MKVVKSNYTVENIDNIIKKYESEYNYKKSFSQKFKKFIVNLFLFITCMFVDYVIFYFIFETFSAKFQELRSAIYTRALFDLLTLFIFLEFYGVIRRLTIDVLNLKDFIYKKSCNEILGEKILQCKLARSYINFQNELLKFSDYDGILTDDGDIKLLNYIDESSGLYKEKVIKVPGEIRDKIYKDKSIDFCFVNEMVSNI